VISWGNGCYFSRLALKIESKCNCFAVPGFLVSQSKHFKSRDAVHIVHTVHKGTGGGHVDDITATADHLQYWRKSSIITVDKIKATWLSFVFSSHSFFRSPLTLRGSRVGHMAGKRCALMQILTRNRKLSCTCAKYPAIGRVGCVSLHVGQMG